MAVREDLIPINQKDYIQLHIRQQDYTQIKREDHGWISKTLQAKIPFTEINRDELLQFLTIARANRARFKVITDNGLVGYFLFILLYPRSPPSTRLWG